MPQALQSYTREKEKQSQEKHDWITRRKMFKHYIKEK